MEYPAANSRIEIRIFSSDLFAVPGYRQQEIAGDHGFDPLCNLSLGRFGVLSQKSHVYAVENLVQHHHFLLCENVFQTVI
jgi:hypothetical protein